MKNSIFSLLLLVFASICLFGCATKLETLPITQRDEEAYNNVLLSKSPSQTQAFVLQTKGSGKVALVNMGTKSGILKGTKIEFYTVKEKRGMNFKIPLAYGRVISADENTAWIQIKNYKKAEVKNNHFARIAPDQSKDFMEKAVTGFGMWGD